MATNGILATRPTGRAAVTDVKPVDLRQRRVDSIEWRLAVMDGVGLAYRTLRQRLAEGHHDIVAQVFTQHRAELAMSVDADGSVDVIEFGCSSDAPLQLIEVVKRTLWNMGAHSVSCVEGQHEGRHVAWRITANFRPTAT